MFLVNVSKTIDVTTAPTTCSEDVLPRRRRICAVTTDKPGRAAPEFVPRERATTVKLDHQDDLKRFPLARENHIGVGGG